MEEKYQKLAEVPALVLGDTFHLSWKGHDFYRRHTKEIHTGEDAEASKVEGAYLAQLPMPIIVGSAQNVLAGDMVMQTVDRARMDSAS